MRDRLHETGQGSRGSGETLKCPRCGSTDYRCLKFRNVMCKKCGCVRHRSAWDTDKYYVGVS